VSQAVVGGVKQPIFGITGTLAAGLEGGINLGFASVSAGLEGGITATVNFGLEDPHGDGKLPGSYIVQAGAINPLGIFDISGKVSAFLDAFVNVKVIGITVYNQDFNLLHVDIVNFDFNCHLANAPQLGTLGSDGTLTLKKDATGANITITHAG